MKLSPGSRKDRAAAVLRKVILWGSLVIVFIVGLAYVVVGQRETQTQELSKSKPLQKETSSSETSAPKSITLTKERRESMGIAVGKMFVEPWIDEKIIQAKLELDPGKHYVVTAPSDLIVEELLVPLGTWVEAGAPLIRLSSSPVSLLRSNLVRQKILANRAMDSLIWHRNVNSEVNALIVRIRESVDLGKPLEDLQSIQPTADYGARIIAAFARYRSAERLLSQTTQFADTGVLSRKSIIERESEREAAKALLQGAIEQSQFDIRQAILQAEAEQASAQGALENQNAELRKYLGLRPSARRNEAEIESDGIASPGAPDQFIHRSPGSGTVLERYFANGERAAMGENLLLVADTSTLWLVGELRQQDWDLLEMKKGEPVQAEIMGMESEGRLQATIQMISGRVVENSGSIRMTALLPNTNLKLRPGMIARLLPRKAEMTRSLPSQAVFSNDGVDYVLRLSTSPQPIALATGDAKHHVVLDEKAKPESGVHGVEEPQTLNATNRFEIAVVECGRRTKDRIEVLGGLGVDDLIMFDHVFELASEAFLERE